MRLAHDTAINYTWTYGLLTFYLFTWPGFTRENGLGRYILFLDFVRVFVLLLSEVFFIWS